jgi:hypothetical protein
MGASKVADGKFASNNACVKTKPCYNRARLENLPRAVKQKMVL